MATETSERAGPLDPFALPEVDELPGVDAPDKKGRGRRTKRPPVRGVWKVLRRSGQVMIAAGFVVLLFLVYQVWGTSFWTKRAQNRLRTQFTEQFSDVVPAATVPVTASTLPGGTPAPATTAPPPDAQLVAANGEAVARLAIGKIGLDVIVVEGVEPDDLRDGPGHYPGTPMPGEDGNVVLSGHRTTYGAPFHNLDHLAEGDSMVVQTRAGEFEYKVQWVQIVNPDNLSVTVSTPGAKEITLTTCHPKFRATERLIVRAVQVAGPRTATLPR